MSGGSYDYLYLKDVGEILIGEGCEDLERMIDRLAGLGYAEDAARESMWLLAEARASRIRLEVLLDRLSPVWQAMEWWDSNDWGEDQFEAALMKYRGESEEGK